MIFSNSPVKTVQEKVNPFSKKNKLSSLKFERKKDYKTFIKFIKDNTKELEQIKIDDKEKKLKRGLVAGGIVGGALLLSLFAGGDDDDSGMREQANKINNFNLVAEKAKADAKKDLKQAKESGKISKTSMLGTVGSSLKKVGLFVKNKAKRFIKTRQRIKNTARIKKNIRIRQNVFNRIIKKIGVKQERGQTTTGGTKYKNITKQVGGNTTGKSTSATATIDDFINADDPFNVKSSNQGKQGPTGGTRGRIRGGKDKFTDQDFKNLQIDQGAEEQIREAQKIDLRKKLKIKSDIRLDRQEQALRASNVLDDFEADSARRAAIEDAEIKKTRSKIDKSKFFDAPDIPKRKKLSGLDKFNRFSSNIFNNPFVRLTSSVFGFIFNAKGEILRTTLTPTQLGPTDEEERRLIEQFSDKPVNIFLNKDQSMIPFNPDLKLNNGVTPPTDFPTPSSNIFIDPKQQLNIDDIFFLRSFSGG